MPYLLNDKYVSVPWCSMTPWWWWVWFHSVCPPVLTLPAFGLSFSISVIKRREEVLYYCYCWGHGLFSVDTKMCSFLNCWCFLNCWYFAWNIFFHFFSFSFLMYVWVLILFSHVAGHFHHIFLPIHFHSFYNWNAIFVHLFFKQYPCIEILSEPYWKSASCWICYPGKIKVFYVSSPSNHKVNKGPSLPPDTPWGSLEQ